ncbi:probable ribosome production factor 1 [Ischnura elegans]|uniref:probable ribosome production factor 1 n=1 Tax=Ischnura elegans TaxID=197161 RepID=UPI001ED8A88C|nr:probable ribosome production factor 1 [Ischnura elegans]
MEGEKSEEIPSIPSHVSDIKNKTVRRRQIEQYKRLKSKMMKEKKKKMKAEGAPKQTPKTIESMREKDETSIVAMEGEASEEVALDVAHDDLSEYYAKTYEPKVLITFSDNPEKKARVFGRELTRIIPNSISRYRNRSGIKKMVKSCIARGFTDIVVINEDMKKPNGLLVIHLPNGPTANFRLSNVKITKDLKKSHKEISEHRPEVILNNFNTRLGHTVGRMLGALFHYDPEFKGRRAVTFHNQRDYIFFRHHRYEFKNSEKVKLRELGPRFTLKLRYLQQGTFDSKHGEYEWIITGRRHEMETSRRKFFL